MAVDGFPADRRSQRTGAEPRLALPQSRGLHARPRSWLRLRWCGWLRLVRLRRCGRLSAGLLEPFDAKLELLHLRGQLAGGFVCLGVAESWWVDGLDVRLVVGWSWSAGWLGHDE